MYETTIYSDEAILDLKLWLHNAATQGHQKFYQVFVDGRIIIHLTENLELLDELNTWILPKTKIVKIQVYNTRSSHRYQLFEYQTEAFVKAQEAEKRARDEDELKKQQSLGGFSSQEELKRSMDDSVKQALEKDRHEREFEQLKSENKRLQAELEESRVYTSKVEKKLETFESQRVKLTTDNVVGIGSAIVSNVVKSNPDLIKVVGGLAGFLHTPEAKNPEGEEALGGMSFKPKGAKSEEVAESEEEEEQEEEEEEEEGAEKVTLDKETLAKLELFNEAAQNLNDEEYDQYFSIVRFLSNQPNKVTDVYTFLKEGNKFQKPAA